MDLSSLSTLIRQQIGQAETAAALKTLLAFLQGNPKHKAFYNIALNIQSLYSRTLQKELKGAVTQEQASVNYTLVNDSIIQLLDQIESGASIPKGFDPKVRAQRMQIWQLILTGVIALVAVGALFFFLRKDQVQTACPDFPEPSQLDVLLIPFVNLSEGELKPEYGIKERLENIAPITSSIPIFGSMIPIFSAPKPSSRISIWQALSPPNARPGSSSGAPPNAWPMAASTVPPSSNSLGKAKNSNFKKSSSISRISGSKEKPRWIPSSPFPLSAARAMSPKTWKISSKSFSAWWPTIRGTTKPPSPP
ncbi:MAG: hypothetical protein IPH04_10780 [Saprospirales bacterium]|nr:hypothetical protein [Saprospirales bacterium]